MNDSGSEPQWERPQLAGRMPAALVEKWGDEVLDEGFVPFPKRLLRCLKDVFVGEHALGMLTVALAIVDYRRPGLRRAPSVGVLAFIAGLSIEDFLARLDDLAKAGLARVSGTPDALQISLDGLYRAIREKSGEG